MTTWMMLPGTILEGNLHCLGAEEEAFHGHRAGMTADLEPAEAKAKDRWTFFPRFETHATRLRADNGTSPALERL